MSTPPDDDRYLWDRSDRQDDAVVPELERLLGRFAHDGRGFEAGKRSPLESRRSRWWRQPLALAAAAILLGIALWVVMRTTAPAPRPKNFHVFNPTTESVMQVGDSLVATAENAVLELHEVGRLQLSVDAHLELAHSREGVVRFRLKSGTLHASIDPSTAAPRFFQVATPHAICVDLGCEYDLTVDPHGETHVIVTQGEVAFETEDDRRVLIPQGAESRASAFGLGTPCFLDADPVIQKMLDELDQRRREPRRRNVAEKLAFFIERPRDSLVLWHLLQDPDTDIAALATEALLRLVGHPEGDALKGAPPVDPATWREFLRQHW